MLSPRDYVREYVFVCVSAFPTRVWNSLAQGSIVPVCTAEFYTAEPSRARNLILNRGHAKMSKTDGMKAVKNS
jgi:hypothetical protein